MTQAHHFGAKRPPLAASITQCDLR